MVKEEEMEEEATGEDRGWRNGRLAGEMVEGKATEEEKVVVKEKEERRWTKR